MPVVAPVMPAFLPQPAPLPHRVHPRPRAPICPLATRSPPKSSAPRALQAVANRLRHELPTLFAPGEKDYSLYAPSVTFEDPLNKFVGVSRYASNIAFLNESPVFSSASLTLYALAIDAPRNTVRTRWTLSMAANLPWRPVVSFTGQSDYVVDPASGKVVRHLDYWDSLDDSAFLSLPAVRDLLAQCMPGRVTPADLGGFELLRRTRMVEVRRFGDDGSGVALEKDTQRSDIWQWAIGSHSSRRAEERVVSDVAVRTLAGPPSSQLVLDSIEREMRAELQRAGYAEPSQNAFYVSAIVRGRRMHEFWVELQHVSTDVEF